MGIHHDAWIVVYIAPDHVGRLSSHSRQGRQLRKLPGNGASVLFHQILTAGNDIFCLHVIKARGVDVLLQLRKLCRRKILQAPVFFKQFLCDDVDPGVGTLGA